MKRGYHRVNRHLWNRARASLKYSKFMEIELLDSDEIFQGFVQKLGQDFIILRDKNMNEFLVLFSKIKNMRTFTFGAGGTR